MLQPLGLPRRIGPHEMHRLGEMSTALLPCSGDLGKVGQVGFKLFPVLATRFQSGEDDQCPSRQVEEFFVVVGRELGDQGVLVGHDERVDLLGRRVSVVEVKGRNRLVHVILENSQDATFGTVDLG